MGEGQKYHRPMKTQINFRASPATAAELAQLIPLLGEGQTEVIARAIASLHAKHHDAIHFEIATVTEGATCPWCGWQYEEPEFPDTSPTWGGRRTPAGGRPKMATSTQIMMKLYGAGPVAGEIWTLGMGGTLAYSVSPSPAFTALDGAQDMSHLDPPGGGEPLDTDKINAHLRQRRQAAGVTWEASLAAHMARFPHETDAEAQAVARPTYP